MNMRFLMTFLLAGCVAIAPAGCEQASDSNGATTSADASSDDDGNAGTPFRHAQWTPAPNPGTLKVHGLQFTKPVTWIETQPTSALRHSNYSVPGRSGEQAAELVVFFLPQVRAVDFEKHVDRWQLQFEPNEVGTRPEPVYMDVSADGEQIPVVRFEGSYRKTGAAWYTPGQAMIAAMLNGVDGQIVFRMSGPATTVEANEQRFLSLIESRQEIEIAEQSDTQDGR